MKRFLTIMAASLGLNGAVAEARAGLIAVGEGQFSAGAAVITFEGPTTALPTIPGVTFPSNSSWNSPWFSGSAQVISFGPKFGGQAWANHMYETTSGLAVDLADPVQAIGGYIARVPHASGAYPTAVTIELLDAAGGSLGTSSVTLDPVPNTPVFFGFTADSPIAGLRAVGDNPMGWFGIDNLVYGSLRPVPEPSSFTLAAAASATWMFYTRRRSRRAG